MSTRLVLAREVKIDIRRFVAVKSKEGLERDIVSVTEHIRSAVGTILLRKVESRTVNTVKQKLAVLALGTDVMRRQRIYLRDSRH